MQCFIGGNFNIKVTCTFVILVIFDLKDKILTKESRQIKQEVSEALEKDI